MSENSIKYCIFKIQLVIIAYLNFEKCRKKKTKQGGINMAKLSIRNRNEGKFYKDGRKKPANWEYRFEGAKIEGKRNTISKAGFKTKKEAEIEGTKALAQYNNAGLHFEPSEISVADYLEYWLNNYCKFNVADSTLTAYRNIIKNHIVP